MTIGYECDHRLALLFALYDSSHKPNVKEKLVTTLQAWKRAIDPHRPSASPTFFSSSFSSILLSKWYREIQGLLASWVFRLPSSVEPYRYQGFRAEMKGVVDITEWREKIRTHPSLGFQSKSSSSPLVFAQEYLLHTHVHGHIPLESSDLLILSQDVMTTIYNLRDATQSVEYKNFASPVELYLCFKKSIKRTHDLPEYNKRVSVHAIVFDKQKFMTPMKFETQRQRTEMTASISSSPSSSPHPTGSPSDDIMTGHDNGKKKEKRKEFRLAAEEKTNVPLTFSELVQKNETWSMQDEGICIPSVCSGKPLQFDTRLFLSNRSFRPVFFRYLFSKLIQDPDMASYRLVIDFMLPQENEEDYVPKLFYQGRITPLPCLRNPIGEGDVAVVWMAKAIENNLSILYPIFYPLAPASTSLPSATFIILGLDKDLHYIALLNAHRFQNTLYSQVWSPTDNQYHLCNNTYLMNEFCFRPFLAEAFLLITFFHDTDFFHHNWLLFNSNVDAVEHGVMKWAVEQHTVYEGIFTNKERTTPSSIFYRPESMFSRLFVSIENSHDKKLFPKVRNMVMETDMSRACTIWSKIMDHFVYWSSCDCHFQIDSPILGKSSTFHFTIWMKEHFMCSIPGVVTTVPSYLQHMQPVQSLSRRKSNVTLSPPPATLKRQRDEENEADITLLSSSSPVSSNSSNVVKEEKEEETLMRKKTKTQEMKMATTSDTSSVVSPPLMPSLPLPTQTEEDTVMKIIITPPPPPPNPVPLQTTLNPSVHGIKDEPAMFFTFPI